MELTTILITTLKLFATSPDLCADVYVDDNGDPYVDALGQTLSRYCEWTGPDAPRLASDVCCTIEGDTAACVLPDSSGRCATGAKLYCEYGEVTRFGTVCYQPLPSACELGFCQTGVQPPDLVPVEDAICCWSDGTCMEIENYSDAVGCFQTNGYGTWCDNGAQNTDGTIECFD